MKHKYFIKLCSIKPWVARIFIFAIEATNMNLVSEYCRDIMELFKHEIYDGLHIEFGGLS